jgi:polyisoprenoid-binding protein YceI
MKLALTAVLLISTASAAAAKDWTLDAKASHLRFSATQQGEPFAGEFARFTPKIAVDPAQPAAAKIDVEIDLASANTKSSERDETLRGEDFFWTSKYPKAHFRTLACKAGAGAGRIECEAELTIRDKTRKLAFPFAFAESAGKATLKAEVTLDRTQYGVGASGDWTDEETVGHQVKVTVDLTLN